MMSNSMSIKSSSKRASFTAISVGLFFCFFLGGCAHRIEKMTIHEGDIQTPYDRLGTVEVRKKVPLARLQDLFYGPASVLTLGQASLPEEWTQIKRDLDAELLQNARGRFGADAIINVKYWPDLKSPGFPQGYAYARGEMVRYTRFPLAAGAKTEPSTSLPRIASTSSEVEPTKTMTTEPI